MLDYIIITRNRVYENEPEDIVREQEEKRNILGLSNGSYICHFFNSVWFDESYREMDIDDAIENLAIKDGVDMVQFSNGNYGFVAYYNGKVNGFEVIR